MSEDIHRVEDLEPEEVKSCITSGYKRVVDKSSHEVYLYHPTHWELITKKGFKYNYMFDNLAFLSKTPEALELAKSEGGEDDIL